MSQSSYRFSLDEKSRIIASSKRREKQVMEFFLLKHIQYRHHKIVSRRPTRLCDDQDWLSKWVSGAYKTKNTQCLHGNRSFYEKRNEFFRQRRLIRWTKKTYMMDETMNENAIFDDAFKTGHEKYFWCWHDIPCPGQAWFVWQQCKCRVNQFESHGFSFQWRDFHFHFASSSDSSSSFTNVLPLKLFSSLTTRNARGFHIRFPKKECWCPRRKDLRTTTGILLFR